MYISQTNVPLEQLINQLENQDEWGKFLSSNKGSYVHIDPRSGRPTSVIAVVPLIPGTGESNTLTLKDISFKLEYEVKEIAEKEINALIKKHIQDNAGILRVNPDEIGEIRISNPADDIWQVFITRQFNGIPVREAGLSFTINHGN